MSLGNNRDYKTADRRARRLLARHKELMDKLMAENPAMTRFSASDTAMRMLGVRKKRKKG